MWTHHCRKDSDSCVVVISCFHNLSSVWPCAKSISFLISSYVPPVDTNASNLDPKTAVLKANGQTVSSYWFCCLTFSNKSRYFATSSRNLFSNLGTSIFGGDFATIVGPTLPSTSPHNLRSSSLRMFARARSCSRCFCLLLLHRELFPFLVLLLPVFLSLVFLLILFLFAYCSILAPFFVLHGLNVFLLFQTTAAVQ